MARRAKYIGSARAEDATPRATGNNYYEQDERSRRNRQRLVRSKLRTARWKAGSTWTS